MRPFLTTWQSGNFIFHSASIQARIIISCFISAPSRWMKSPTLHAKLITTLTLLSFSLRFSVTKTINRRFSHSSGINSRLHITTMSSSPSSSIDALMHCQCDSYQQKSLSRVLKCWESNHVDSTVFHVILENSVLYPEGGGQVHRMQANIFGN